MAKTKDGPADLAEENPYGDDKITIPKPPAAAEMTEKEMAALGMPGTAPAPAKGGSIHDIEREKASKADAMTLSEAEQAKRRPLQTVPFSEYGSDPDAALMTVNKDGSVTQRPDPLELGYGSGKGVPVTPEKAAPAAPAKSASTGATEDKEKGPATDMPWLPVPPGPEILDPSLGPVKGNEKPTEKEQYSPGEKPKLDSTDIELKDKIGKVLRHKGRGDLSKEEKFNFADMIKGAGKNLGDWVEKMRPYLGEFLETTGRASSGDYGETVGDIRRRQDFTLEQTKRQQAQLGEIQSGLAAENAQHQQALQTADNEYQQARQRLNSQLLIAQMDPQASANIRQQLEALDATHTNTMSEMALAHTNKLKEGQQQIDLLYAQSNATQGANAQGNYTGRAK